MAATSTLHHQIEEAVEPVSQFWPMKSFVHHNPIHGLEHLPFDAAIREAKHLFGAEGYLPNDEYRGFYQAGRIKKRSVDRALAHVGPQTDASVSLASRNVTATEVQRIHLLHGIDALEPALFDWQFASEGVLSESRTGASSEVALDELWQRALSVLQLTDPRVEDHMGDAANGSSAKPELPFRRTLSDWLDELTGSTIVATIDEQMIKWVASFVDEGMAGWQMPGKRSGFYAAWRELAEYDASGGFLGIDRFAEKVAALPSDPEAAIRRSLEALQIPEARWTDYLTRVLAQLSGWTGFIRWRGLNPDDLIQKECPIDVVHYLGVRLFYEAELASVEARRQWDINGTLPAITAYLKDHGGVRNSSVSANKLSVCRDAWRVFHLAQFLALPADAVREMAPEDATTLLAWLDAFPADQHGPVWLEAYEDSYRDDILSKLAAHHGTVAETGERPLAQVAFCIDVRSEPFRRHFEKAGSFETIGYAGFFGIPISHRVFDTDESPALCPVLLTPSNALFELPRGGQQEALSSYASGSRWQQFGEQLFHDLKHNPVASFLLVDVLGLFFSVGLVGKTMVRRPYETLVRAANRWFLRPVATEIKVGVDTGEPPKVVGQPTELTRGFTVEEQATFVENGLRTVGLTKNLGHFVVLCGHGGNSDNNPYYSALDCGACGGKPGDPNARVFAAMGNNPNVRAELATRGLEIPADTWFLPGKHDTNTDRVDLYDLEDVPSSHQDDLTTLRQGFEEGGAQQALERCGRIPGTPRGMTAKQAYAHVNARSFDWANPRPEWGLSGNAAFIIGRRTLTKGLDLGGRSFLHSYDSGSDPEGAILEKIMTAPLVVGEWINMEHYFSATDPWNYGSGSKVIHNVVSGIGVMYGAQSDLATGLPLQTVNNGEIHKHEPMRLLTIIEADPGVIGAIIGRHEVLQQFFHNEWVNLVALDSHTFEFHRYYKDATWEPIEL
jgi:uncharacterized protein YbcC (UPF0753/DUF2309 family)